MTHSPLAEQGPRLAHNVEVSRGWNDSRWSSWFRGACDEPRRREFQPFRFHPNARPAEEVETIYIAFPESSRHAMRLGLAHAIGSWNPVHYTYGVLGRLCWIVSQLHATETIAPLLQIVKDYRSVLFSGDTNTLATADDIVSILGGFVPDPDGRIEAVFTDILYDDKVVPHFAGSLAVAISTSRPSQFARLFSRYFALRRKAPEGFYEDEQVVTAFSRAVPRENVYKGVEDLSGAACDYWMTVGVRARIIPLSALTGVDGEGAPDAETFVLPFPHAVDEMEHSMRRREIVWQAIQETLTAAGAGDSAEKVDSMSKVDQLYAAAELVDDEAAA